VSEKSKNNQVKQLGGRRPGSGRKPGQLGIKARTALEIKNRIAESADNLLNAELLEGLGSFVVMKADPETLEYQQVTDEDEIIRFIQAHKGANGRMGGQVYILVAKPGNYKSRQYLFDRAFGRPSQSVEVTTDPKVADLKAKIQARAQEKGVTYEQELALWGESYSDNVDPAIKAKLLTEVVQ
jgi:hypothetical protein